jgi:hypothetical protein
MVRMKSPPSNDGTLFRGLKGAAPNKAKVTRSCCFLAFLVPIVVWVVTISFVTVHDGESSVPRQRDGPQLQFQHSNKLQPPPSTVTKSNAQAPPVQATERQAKPREQRRHGSLKCDNHGGPSAEFSQEMVYWQDIPSDGKYVSPFRRQAASQGEKYMVRFYGPVDSNEPAVLVSRRDPL